MQKIISLFQRNHEGDHLVRDEVVPGAEWVIAGEGVATRKWDGTACLVKDGELFKRYDAKKGKTPPPEFIPAQEKPDLETGHWPGWVPVGEGPEDKYHREGFERLKTCYQSGVPEDGTYELIGPKVQGNPEHHAVHMLERHGNAVIQRGNCPHDFQGLQAFFEEHDIEGIVWHHPDGRMVKIKGKDFGIKRQQELTTDD